MCSTALRKPAKDTRIFQRHGDHSSSSLWQYFIGVHSNTAIFRNSSRAPAQALFWIGLVNDFIPVTSSYLRTRQGISERCNGTRDRSHRFGRFRPAVDSFSDIAAANWMAFVTLFAAVRKGSRRGRRIQCRMKRDLNIAVEWNGRIENAAKVDECHRTLKRKKKNYRPFPALRWRRNSTDAGRGRVGHQL